jgi:hypothetical protein
MGGITDRQAHPQDVATTPQIALTDIASHRRVIARTLRSVVDLPQTNAIDPAQRIATAASGTKMNGTPDVLTAAVATVQETIAVP